MATEPSPSHHVNGLWRLRRGRDDTALKRNQDGDGCNEGREEAGRADKSKDPGGLARGDTEASSGDNREDEQSGLNPIGPGNRLGEVRQEVWHRHGTK